MAEIDEGSVIGNYRVIRLLGQGGMGTVYEVEHLELGTHYALKTFTFDPDNAANHALKKKFLEEGKLLARLKHPNLTHVFDLGFEDETQMPYFVMDLVTYEDGETYTVEDIDLKDIDEDMVYGWFKQLASALDYIHGEGIVHRDIKPSNLLVDKDLNVVLTDFGISRIFGQKIKSEVEATRTMVSKTGRGKLVLGTEHYIAPEVADGEEATPKADAYSLGVMLLRWLTGFYYGDNPGAVALLSRKKYQWVGVISQLLAPASRRPEKYSELVRQLKPAPKPTPAAKPLQGKKKRNRTKENITAAVLGILIVSILGAGGYFGWRVWQQSEAAKRQQKEQMLAMQKQIAEAKAAAEAAEAAQKAKEAEEKRIAEEKRKAREAKLAEQKRIEESRTKIEKQDVSQLAMRETPVPEEKKETQEPEPEKPKEEFVVVKEETPAEEVKDYDPIPDKKYTWLFGNNADKPNAVRFQLSNGAEIDLVPQKPGIFFMSNGSKGGKAKHKVTITRPFWVSKYCVYPEQWRDYAPNDCEDMKPYESIIGKKYYVHKQYTRKEVESFCQFLTEKYRSQIPVGYVFRLPTEAEWEYAMDLDNTSEVYKQSGDRVWWDVVASGGKDARKVLEGLKKNGLSKIDDWEEGWRNAGWSRKKGVMIGGRAKPHTSGVCDMLGGPHMLLDEVPKNGYPEYADEEIDPLHLCAGEKSYLARAWEYMRAFAINDSPFHVILGPDIVNEVKRNGGFKFSSKAPGKVPNRKYDWNPAKVPNKISHPKEIKFKMACGEEMVFCTCPKGRFTMTNHKEDNKKFHQVELTYPFWFSKYCVTVQQWREWGPYDCEGKCRKVEKCLPPGMIVCCSFYRANWVAFCEYLTKQYREQLPQGYIFRLPTEAEWEYAYLSDIKDRGTAYDVPDDERNNYWHPANKMAFAKLLKKNKALRSVGDWSEGGGLNGMFIGARLKPNAWGVCDMRNYMFLTLDTWFDQYGEPLKNFIRYEDKEVDPLHWEGRLGARAMYRDGPHKGVFDEWGRAYAHIVVGPDLESPHTIAEKSPFPKSDFGGDYLGDIAKVSKLSSYQPGFNQDEKLKLLLSLEPTIIHTHGEMRAIHTRYERSPWVEVEFDSVKEIYGVQVDIYCGKHAAHHLRIWSSEDGKKWREIAKEDQLLGRYRFDLKSKKVKAKYLRVGREPGFREDHFWLHKVLIYGKK